jgi:hypothetical protein
VIGEPAHTSANVKRSNDARTSRRRQYKEFDPTPRFHQHITAQTLAALSQPHPPPHHLRSFNRAITRIVTTAITPGPTPATHQTSADTQTHRAHPIVRTCPCLYKRAPPSRVSQRFINRFDNIAEHTLHCRATSASSSFMSATISAVDCELRSFERGFSCSVIGSAVSYSCLRWIRLRERYG